MMKSKYLVNPRFYIAKQAKQEGVFGNNHITICSEVTLREAAIGVILDKKGSFFFPERTFS